MLRALLLDLDDTAYSTHDAYPKSVEGAHRAAKSLWHGWEDFDAFKTDYDAARHTIRDMTGNAPAWHSRLLYFKEMLEMRTGRSQLETAMRLRDAYWNTYFSVIEIDPGCAETLEWLRGKGVKTAWVTNFTTEPQIRKLQTLGLTDAVDVLMASEEAGAEKPDPALFQAALKKLGVDARDAWMVGDNIKVDMPPARKLGMTSVWYRRNHDADTAVTSDVDHVIEDWAGFRALLEEALDQRD